MKKILGLGLMLVLLNACLSFEDVELVKAIEGRWSVEEINQWKDEQGWRLGCNYIPAYAINQLEMWQEDTFSIDVIEKELILAEEIGFNLLRVFLHDELWNEDADGFKARVEEFLMTSDKYGLKVLFVFFDDCWNSEGSIGVQPEAKPGVHNSGWLQSPFASKRSQEYLPDLEAYIKGFLSAFKDDARIYGWDLFNEPGGFGNGEKSITLLEYVFKWAREINPSQPLTAGVWYQGFKNLYAFQLANSDMISFHNYSSPDKYRKELNYFQSFGRPIVCTEYMARKLGSTFQNTLPFFKKQEIDAVCWGFIAGKSNTIWPWDSPEQRVRAEPRLWFHDIFRQLPDGSYQAYSEEEVATIKKLAKK